MGKVQKFEDLTIFQMARDLCKEVYKITKEGDFAKDSRFVQQIHAAAGSIMDNIAEGYEPTHEASAEISSLNLCLTRRRKTKVNVTAIRNL